MKKLFLLSTYCLLLYMAHAQQTYTNKDPQEKFYEAKAYFQKEQYSLAYPLLKELQQSLQETNKINTPVVAQEIDYYTIVCALMQNEGRAEQLAQNYLNITKNNS